MLITKRMNVAPVRTVLKIREEILSKKKKRREETDKYHVAPST